MNVYKLLLLIIFSISSLINAQSSYASPIKDVPKSKIYKKTLGKNKKHGTVKKLYTAKWFNPGSFYGQAFLQENGHLFIYEWLDIPKEVYSPTTTSVKKDLEYLETSRTYLDGESKPVIITILLPHPRSLESIKQGLLEDFLKFTPKESEIARKLDVNMGSRKGAAYEYQDGHCTVVIKATNEVLVEAKVENCKHQPNLLKFTKDLNWELFDKRIQS